MTGKSNKSAEHVEKKFHLLVEVLKRPQEFRTHTLLGKALRRQSTFSGFFDSGLGLDGCSINTFKSCANAVIPGGFRVVDNLRLQALKVFDETSAPRERSDTVRSLQKSIKLQNKNIQHLEEHVLRMTYIHSRIMHMYNRLADLSPDLVRPTYVKDRAEIYSLIAALDLVEFWDLT